MRAALLVLLALLVAGCSSRPSTSHCEKAVDHMIDIFVAPRVPEGQAAPPEAVREADAWKKALKEKDPMRAALIDTCRKKMSDSVASCILEATDEGPLAACFSG